MMRYPTLADIWDQQEAYNNTVRKQQIRSDPEWMINYILGAMSELSELLDQTNWKTHRITTTDQFGPNVAEELADITKYVFSMWQLMGFTETNMLLSMREKGDILQQLMFQEMRPPLKDQNILMLDLDGVVADFRMGFIKWVSANKWKSILQENERNIGLHLDIDHNWDFSSYTQAKIEFEKSGGYSSLPTIALMKRAINVLSKTGWYIIVYTARPYTVYKRIWGDTWNWLREHAIHVNELHFGYDTRVVAAHELSKNNHVVALEDDPTLIQRYLGCEIPVFVYPQPYNEALQSTSHLLNRISVSQENWEIVNAIQQTSEKESRNA